MHIVFLTSSAPTSESDSTAPFILTMAEDVQALGHDVTILSPHVPKSAEKEVINGVEFCRFRYFWPETWQKLSGKGGIMPTLRRKPWLFWQIPFFVLAQMLALYRLLKSHPVDVVHSHWLLPQGLVGALLARRSGMPHVVMVHGADVFGLPHPLWRWCKQKVIECSESVIVNSHYTATHVQALAADCQPEVIPVGASPLAEGGSCALQRDDYADSDAMLLGFMGRLIEEKGLHVLLEAFTRLRFPARLLVLGDGAQRAALQAQAESLGISSQVRFMGAVAHARIYDYLSLCDAFVAPSIQTKHWVEAQGNAIVEAMMAGLPVIASNVGGIPDAVIHEQTGLLVPERDPDALAAAITRLHENPDFSAELASAGSAHVLAHFSRYESARRIAAVYASVARAPN